MKQVKKSRIPIDLFEGKCTEESNFFFASLLKCFKSYYVHVQY